MTLTRRRLLQWSAALAAALAACAPKTCPPRLRLLRLRLRLPPPPPPPRPRPRRCRGRRHRQAAGDRLRLPRPGRRCRLDLCPRARTPALIEAFGDRIRTTYVENVPESGAEAERVFLDLASQGKQLIFGTSFGYMEPMLKIASNSRGALRARHRLQDRVQSMSTPAACTSRPSRRGHRRPDDAQQRAGLRRRGAHPGSDPQYQCLHAGRARRQPEGGGQGGLGQQVVRPRQGARGGGSAGRPARRCADPEHRFAGRAAVRRGKGLRAFGWDSDMSRFGPRAHLASAVFNWGVYYKQTVATCWRAAGSPPPPVGHQAGDERPVSLDDKLPAAVRASLASHRRHRRAGQCRHLPRPAAGQHRQDRASLRAPAPTTRPCWR